MTFSKSQKHSNLRHRCVMLNTPRRRTLSTSVTATCTRLIELQNPQGLEREKPSTNTHHFSTPPIRKVFINCVHDNLHLATHLCHGQFDIRHFGHEHLHYTSVLRRRLLIIQITGTRPWKVPLPLYFLRTDCQCSQ